MITLKNYHTQDGTKTVLVDDRGSKWLRVLMMDGTLTVKRVPKEEERYMREVHEGKKRRSISGAVAVFASYGRNVGQTKAAREFLREARS